MWFWNSIFSGTCFGVDSDEKSPRNTMRFWNSIVFATLVHVLESEKSQIKQNVLDFEPRQALFVTDSDPLKYYEFIINFSKNHFNQNGQIFFEINENKRKGIKNILDENDQYKSDFLHDSFKKTRFLKIRF